MEKIEFYRSIFNAEEINSMAKQMLTAIKEAGPNNEILLKASSYLETSNEFLTGILHSVKKNPYSEQLGKEDDKRDMIFVAGRNIAEGFTHYVFDEDKKKAAERIVAVIRRHGWSMQDFRYQDQSAATNSLLKELRFPGNQADLALINLMDWFKELVKSQEEFEKIFNDKTLYASTRESGEKKKAKIPVINDIENFINCINTLVLFTDTDEAIKKIYNNVDGICKQATTSSKIRRSNIGKKTDDDVNGTSDNDEAVK